jgi:amino acid adenylation domain-containing protein
VGLEEPVALMIPASREYVIAMLGIVKAGGSYLPIDSDAPAKRIEYMLQDSRSRFALTNPAGMKRLAGWPGVGVQLAEIIGRNSMAVHQISDVPPDPQRRAYIVYTSGSTGQPKGVEVEHHSLANLVFAYKEQFNITRQEHSTILANVAFDASVAEVWPTLCAGGSLFVPPGELIRRPDNLIAWLAEEKITRTYIPTGLAEILFTRTWPKQMPLRFLVTGGDRLGVHPPRYLPFTVLNAYGPTENTVISTWSVLEPQAESHPLPAIGRPIANVKAYVLDENRQPVPDGTTGELYLGGEQVARGYLGQPALTAEHFFADPFAGQPDSRMYRTGDWVRRLPNGELDFLGRRDNQVQINGRRVELGEIEAVILTLEHPPVWQVCCLPLFEDGQATGITAHLVSKKEHGDFSNVLRTHLGARLPAYMQPSQFLFYEQLPLTPNGKVDRAALAELFTKKSVPSRTDEDADGLETALARLWDSLLPAAKTSARDTTFSNLGGDSLTLVKLMLGVEEITNQSLEASAFLVQPTLPGLCRAAKLRMSETEFQPVLTLRKHGSRPPLFCLYNCSGDIDAYVDLAAALGDDQPVFGIRSPALRDISRLPGSMEAAAEEIIGSIRKIQPDGAPALIGYSWAVLTAFEVSRRLAREEGVFCFTGLIGGDAPLLPTTFFSRVTHFISSFPPWIWQFIANGRNRWQRILRWQKVVMKSPAKIHMPLSVWVSTPISRHLVGLMEKYCPRPKSKAVVCLFRERGSYEKLAHPLYAWQTNHLPDGGWNRWLCNEAQVHWLAGGHKTIIKPPEVFGLAQAIRQAMDSHHRLYPPRQKSMIEESLEEADRFFTFHKPAYKRSATPEPGAPDEPLFQAKNP